MPSNAAHRTRVGATRTTSSASPNAISDGFGHAGDGCVAKPAPHWLWTEAERGWCLFEDVQLRVA